MSADNWDVCPKCLRRAEHKRRKAARRLAAAYGQVPVEEYDRLKAEVEQPFARSLTLREDYQVGVTEGGEFFVIYRCECQNPDCNFKFVFKHEQQLDLNVKGTERDE